MCLLGIQSVSRCLGLSAQQGTWLHMDHSRLVVGWKIKDLLEGYGDGPYLAEDLQ